MSIVKITQTRSLIKKTQHQKKVMKALGLGKINRFVEKEMSPQLQGMINKVHHLVSVTEV